MNPELINHFILETYNGSSCLIRTNPKLITFNMGTEFYHILNTQLQTQSEDNDWKYDYQVKSENETEYCICGKKIENLVHIKYCPQNLWFQVGMDCIQKNLNPIYERIKEEIKEKKRKEKFRQCVACEDFVIRIDEPTWKTKCKSCFKDGIDENPEFYRMCKYCEDLSILKTEPEWKTKCKTCYKEENIEYLSGRECKICLKNTIHKDDPIWKNTCILCFKNK